MVQAASLFSAEKCTPTVTDASHFNAKIDAEALRNAIEGLGTDEQSIIDILTERGIAQRMEIAAAYEALSRKDLIADLKDELSFNFKNVVVGLMTPLAEFYAKELNDAMAGIGTDEAVLIEIICTLSNCGILAVAAEYKKLFNTSLENDLRSNTSGCFAELLVSLVQGRRNEDLEVDEYAVRQDVEALYKAGEGSWGTDESMFNCILVQRSYLHLREVFVGYEKKVGHGIEQTIEGEFSGDNRRALLTLVKSIKYRIGFFAERLYKSMAGPGTDDKTLIRIIVTRSEIDLGNIKEAFELQRRKSLRSWIEDNTSGDYRKILLGLVK